MICTKCGSSNVIEESLDSIKCKDCGYTIIIKRDNKPEEIKFKSGEPHFDSRKYTCDPSWMKQWGKVNFVKKISGKILKFLEKFKRKHE